MGFDITQHDPFDVTRIDEFQGAAARQGVAIRAVGLAVNGVVIAGGAVLSVPFGAPIGATIAFGAIAGATFVAAAWWFRAFIRSRPPEPSADLNTDEDDVFPSERDAAQDSNGNSPSS